MYTHLNTYKSYASSPLPSGMISPYLFFHRILANSGSKISHALLNARASLFDTFVSHARIASSFLLLLLSFLLLLPGMGFPLCASTER